MRHFTQVLLPFLVRLACVRHAASVDSEPGSNSRLKLFVGSPLTEVSERPTASALLYLNCFREQGACRCYYFVRMIKPNSITSHDWHVQPICQRSLRVIRLSGPFWIEAQTRKSRCPRTCCAHWFCVLPQLPAFLREPSKPIEVYRSCQGLFLAQPEE